MKDTKLAGLVWNARTMADVEAIIKHVTTKHTIAWRPVGDRPNNAGTINVASSPGMAMVERATNFIDGMLEMAFDLTPTPGLSSPRSAASTYFSVPATGLGDMSEKDRRALAESMRISLDDSGNPKRPSVLVEDRGIGVTAAMAPATVLSLNEQNKIGKPYTMGTYGQGGAATFSFAKATTMVMRRHPKLLGGAADDVGWTIVMERDDPAKKVANYEYLVDGTTNELFTLDPADFPGFDHGLRLVHVEYDLQLTGPWTTQPYYFFQAAMPTPVLPFLLGGTRTAPKDVPGDRVIIGNSARLDNVDKARGEIEVPYQETVDVELEQDGHKYGRIRIRYWVVRRPAGSAVSSDPTGGYVDASSAISISLHGQRQDTEARSWINSKAKLPFLYRNLVVQIEADDLTPQAKKDLFASTRERARSSDVRTLIYDQLADILTHDSELERLDDEERERLLKKSTAKTNEKIRKRLSQFIKHKLTGTTKPGPSKSTTTAGAAGGTSGGKASGGGGGGGGGGGTSTRNLDDTHLPTVPTLLRFERDEVPVDQGGRAHLWVEIDAKNGYLPDKDGDLVLTIDGPDPSKVKVTARSVLGGGHSRWVIQADSDAPTGDYKLTAELTTPLAVLADTVPVVVKAPPAAKKGTKAGTQPDTGPRVEWVVRDEWAAHNPPMTEHAVGYVTVSSKETIIFVNRHYGALDKAMKAPGMTKEKVEGRADRYQYPIACALWLQKHDYDLLVEKGAVVPTDDWIEAERQRIAEAVLLAITPDVDAAAVDPD